MKAYFTHLSLILVFLSIHLISFAQPIGCMEAKQQIPLHPLTEAEKAALLASNERSDTIDIVNYEITLDVVQFSQQELVANSIVRFSPKMENIDYLALDLLDLTVDSVVWSEGAITYTHDGLLLEIFFPSILNTSDTTNVTVFYHGTPTVDPSGFGGFDFNSGYAYNLGIGLASNPYNFGRSWFPCFDNFVERSTYDFNILTLNPYKGYCVGSFMGQTNVGGDSIIRRYELDQPIPTYLAGVAVSNYSEYNEVHEGAYGPVDLQVVARTPDLNDAINTFASLADAVDALEFWYGPYVWDRVGYVMTVQGAMEHPGNIAYPFSVGLTGDDLAHKRLMAHELGHCWFGDIVTLSTPADMWFKEGNAEYCAHLFTEYISSNDAFLSQVKSNFLNNVLKSAHYDDDGFQPLSGIPYEHTYGTHTYRKGASMVHNLRAYLGDSLFRIGQRQVLETFAYGAVTAEMYRDELIAATGETDKMTSFFDDWIYNPGYAAYEIDSVLIEQAGSQYDVTLHIQQKLRAAPNLHTNTPLQVSFMDENWNHYTTEVLVSDEFSEVEVSVPFEPEIWFLNEDHKLNMGVIGDQRVVTGPLIQNLGSAEFQLRVDAVQDSAFVRVDHFWVAPDELGLNPDGAQISQNHFWRVTGVFPEIFEAEGLINYNGLFPPELDEDLTSMTEDSLILVYRPFPGIPWTEYAEYIKAIGSPVDGRGIITINNLQKGDYAFANGTLDIVSVPDVFQNNTVQIFPNPTSDYLIIQSNLDSTSDLKYRIFDLKGQVLESKQLTNEIAVKQLTSGNYILQLLDQENQSVGVQQFEVIR